MRTPIPPGLVLAVVCLLPACAGSTSTPMNNDPTKTALTAQYCKQLPDGSYAFDATPIGITTKEGPAEVVEGGGCVNRSIRETWAATHNKTTLHWEGADLLSFAGIVDPRVTFLFRTKYEAGPAGFKQQWTLDWFHTLKEGTLAEPKRVLINFRKTEGTEYIAYWDASVELVALAPNVTGLSMRNVIYAAEVGPEEATGSIVDFTRKTRQNPPSWEFLKEL